MHTKVFLTTLFLLVFLVGTIGQTKQATMTNADVIKLVKIGLDNDLIITTIESATGKFDVSSNGLVSLKTANVPSTVIKSMIARMQGTKSQTNQGALATTTTPTPAVGNTHIPEPDIINAIYAYDKSSKKIKPLEKSSATQKVHRAALGYGATTYTCEIPGEKSSTRLPQDDALSFVINTGSAAPDAVVLFKVELKKKQRMATMSKITGLGSMKGAQGSSSCTFKMLKQGIYEITPPSKLDKGEYFFTTKQLDFTTMANMDVYAFGID